MIFKSLSHRQFPVTSRRFNRVLALRWEWLVYFGQDVYEGTATTHFHLCYTPTSWVQLKTKVGENGDLDVVICKWWHATCAGLKHEDLLSPWVYPAPHTPTQYLFIVYTSWQKVIVVWAWSPSDNTLYYVKNGRLHLTGCVIPVWWLPA